MLGVRMWISQGHRHSYCHCDEQRYQIEAASVSLTRAIHASLLQRQLAGGNP